MFYWAVGFCCVAIVAAVFAFSGLEQETAHIGKIVAAVGLALALAAFYVHRRSLID